LSLSDADSLSPQMSFSTADAALPLWKPGALCAEAQEAGAKNATARRYEYLNAGRLSFMRRVSAQSHSLHNDACGAALAQEFTRKKFYSVLQGEAVLFVR